MRTWNTFWRLNSRDRRAVVSVASAIAASHIGLRVFGYRRWTALLSRLSASTVRPVSEDNISKILPEHLARLMVASARNLPFKATCLERSIGLWWLFRRSGFDAQIRIGARKTGSQFEAHAWVEYAGVVFDYSGDEHRNFSVFSDAMPTAARELR